MATREEWLNEAAHVLEETVLEPAGFRIEGQWRIACGWPSRAALSSTRRTIGQCWPTEASADGTHEMFISPCLAEPVKVLATLVHEMIHAAIGCDKKHNGAFKRAAKAVGLAGKPTQTYAEEGSPLHGTLTVQAARLGTYPHATLDKSVLPKQGTRLLKVECPQCSYTVRITRKWIEVGLPTCPCGTKMEEA